MTHRDICGVCGSGITESNYQRHRESCGGFPEDIPEDRRGDEMTDTHTDEETESQRDHRHQAESAIWTVQILEDLISGDLEDWSHPLISYLEDLGLDPEDDELDLFSSVLDSDVLEIFREDRVYMSGLRLPGDLFLVTGTGGPHTQVRITQSGWSEAKTWTWFGQDEVTVSGPLVENLQRVLSEIMGDEETRR